jgi:hypothetical protein
MTKLVFSGLLAGILQAATTLTGTLQTPTGAVGSGTLYLAANPTPVGLTNNCKGQAAQGFTPGQVTITNGIPSGNLVFFGSDCLLPSGIQYNVRYTDQNGNSFVGLWGIFGATFSLSTAPALTAVTGNSAITGVTAGTVTSAACNSSFTPNWLTCTFGGSPAVTPVLQLGAATGQIAHQVIGTCGTATSFAPCALASSDLPATLTPTALSIASASAATDGATLGAELTSSSGWTSTGWTGSYNAFTHTTGNTNALTFPVAGIAANQFYQVVLVLTSVSAGSMTYSIGGSDTVSAPSGATMIASGTYTSAPQTTGTGLFTITPSNLFVGTVAISIKLITHASASTVQFLDSGSNLIQSISQIAAVHQNIGIFTPTTLGVGYTGNGFATLTTTGSYATAFGPNCPLCSNTTGTYNTAIGGGALRSNTSGWYNTAVGDDSQAFNSTGYDNSSLGVDALYQNTTGSSNTAVGFQALIANTTGSTNTAVGQGTLTTNVTGSANVAIGVGALNKTTVSDQTCVGVSACTSTTTGVGNTALGWQALDSETTGFSNVAVGVNAGFYIVGGGQDVCVGYNSCGTSGSAVTSANNVTYVGYGAGPSTGTQYANAFGFGQGAATNAANTGVLGNSSVTDIYLGSTTPAALLHSHGSQFGGTVYSVAGTALPTCAAGTLLDRLAVSDATVATPGTTYAGSGTFTVAVQCTFNSSGSVYTWIID